MPQVFEFELIQQLSQQTPQVFQLVQHFSQFRPQFSQVEQHVFEPQVPQLVQHVSQLTPQVYQLIQHVLSISLEFARQFQVAINELLVSSTSESFRQFNLPANFILKPAH